MQLRHRSRAAFAALCAVALVACGDAPAALSTAAAQATATVAPAATVAATVAPTAAPTVAPTATAAPAATMAPAPTPTVAVTAAPTRTPEMASATPATGATGGTATGRPASSITAAFGTAPVSGGTGPNATMAAIGTNAANANVTIAAISTNAVNANRTVTTIAGQAATGTPGAANVGTAAPAAMRTGTATGVAAVGGTGATGTPRASVAATPRASATTRATSTPRAAGTAVAAMAGERYREPRGRFSFEVPQGWEPGQASGASVIVRYDSVEPLGLFNVTSESLPAGITLDRYIQISLDKLKMQQPDTTFSGDPQDVMLGGEPAKMLRYEATINGSRLAVMQVAAIRDRTAYVLTFGTLPVSADEYFASGDLVLTSWQFM